jgi:hypothetical protein
MNLNFDNNWRRTLLLTKQSNKDLDIPASYVILKVSNLPCTFNKFCEQFAYEYKFDYDVNNKVLWPDNDKTPISVLADTINNDFPKTASVIKKPPYIIHNLSWSDLEDF